MKNVLKMLYLLITEYHRVVVLREPWIETNLKVYSKQYFHPNMKTFSKHSSPNLVSSLGAFNCTSNVSTSSRRAPRPGYVVIDHVTVKGLAGSGWGLGWRRWKEWTVDSWRPRRNAQRALRFSAAGVGASLRNKWCVLE